MHCGPCESSPGAAPRWPSVCWPSRRASATAAGRGASRGASPPPRPADARRDHLAPSSFPITDTVRRGAQPHALPTHRVAMPRQERGRGGAQGVAAFITLLSEAGAGLGWARRRGHSPTTIAANRVLASLIGELWRMRNGHQHWRRGVAGRARGWPLLGPLSPAGMSARPWRML